MFTRHAGNRSSRTISLFAKSAIFLFFVSSLTACNNAVPHVDSDMNLKTFPPPPPTMSISAASGTGIATGVAKVTFAIHYAQGGQSGNSKTNVRSGPQEVLRNAK